MDTKLIQQNILYLKELIDTKNYDQAVNFADTISWKNIKSIELLKIGALAYEYAEYYEDSENLLKRAYSISDKVGSVQKQLLKLYIKEGKLDEAKRCIDDFNNNRNKDVEVDYLEYIVKKKLAYSSDELIKVLESIQNTYYKEEWMYSLAKEYEDAGFIEKCINQCEQIELWFNNGEIVSKALLLKEKYKPLTEEEKSKIIDNNKKIVKTNRNNSLKSEDDIKIYDKTYSDIYTDNIRDVNSINDNINNIEKKDDISVFLDDDYYNDEAYDDYLEENTKKDENMKNDIIDIETKEDINLDESIDLYDNIDNTKYISEDIDKYSEEYIEEYDDEYLDEYDDEYLDEYDDEFFDDLTDEEYAEIMAGDAEYEEEINQSLHLEDETKSIPDNKDNSIKESKIEDLSLNEDAHVAFDKKIQDKYDQNDNVSSNGVDQEDIDKISIDNTQNEFSHSFIDSLEANKEKVEITEEDSLFLDDNLTFSNEIKKDDNLNNDLSDDKHQITEEELDKEYLDSEYYGNDYDEDIYEDFYLNGSDETVFLDQEVDINENKKSNIDIDELSNNNIKGVHIDNDYRDLFDENLQDLDSFASFGSDMSSVEKIVTTLDNLNKKYNSNEHIVLYGESKNLIEEFAITYFRLRGVSSARKVSTIDGHKLNDVDIKELYRKIPNTFLIIKECEYITRETLNSIIKAKNYNNNTIMIFTTDIYTGFKALEDHLFNTMLMTKLEISNVINDYITYTILYAKSKGYHFTECAIDLIDCNEEEILSKNTSFVNYERVVNCCIVNHRQHLEDNLLLGLLHGSISDETLIDDKVVFMAIQELMDKNII